MNINKHEEQLWQNALKLMPRGTQTMSKCPDQFVDGVYPKFASHAKGAYIYDSNNNRYLDFMCGLGPIILGYCDENVNAAIRQQISRGTIFSLPTQLEQDVAQLIVDTVPSIEMVRFAKNGTDATLAAVRIARAFTKKEHIAKCGYHGWGDWHGITIRPDGIPSVLSEYVHTFEYNNLDSLNALLQHNNIAGVIMEVQALTAPKPGFLEGIRTLCDEYKAVLIFDEVVTGYRWALGGAQEYYNVEPDLTCLGKAIANGLPLSVIGGKRELMEVLNYAFFSMTFGGECLSLAAAAATINKLRKCDYSHIWELGNAFADGMNAAALLHGLSINFAGSGPRHNLTFSADEYGEDKAGLLKDVFYQEMCKQKILFSNVLYISFAHTNEDIGKTIIAANNAFKFVKTNINNLEAVLEGKRSVAVFRKNV